MDRVKAEAKLKEKKVSELRSIARQMEAVILDKRGKRVFIHLAKQRELIKGILQKEFPDNIEEKMEEKVEEKVEESPRKEAGHSATITLNTGVIAEDVYGLIKDRLPSLATEKREITVIKPDGGRVDVGKQHEKFEDILKLVSLRMNAMLVGPAGAGKTHCCSEVAKALSLDFAFISVGAQTTKTDIMGYMDAKGRYIGTAYTRLVENGGVFLMDEIDASNPNILTIINATLSNGVMALPNGKTVKKHKDFVFICAANTYGKGADRRYVGRNALDAATLDRFIVIDFNYDEALEDSLCGNKEWLKKVRKIRAKAEELKLDIVVSPRASMNGEALLANGFSEEDTLNMVVFKGANKEIENRLRTSL